MLIGLRDYYGIFDTVNMASNELLQSEVGHCSNKTVVECEDVLSYKNTVQVGYYCFSHTNIPLHNTVLL